MTIRDLFKVLDDSFMDSFDKIIFFDVVNEKQKEASIMVLGWYYPLDMYSDIANYEIESFGISRTDRQTLRICYKGEPEYKEVKI